MRYAMLHSRDFKFSCYLVCCYTKYCMHSINKNYVSLLIIIHLLIITRAFVNEHR